MFPLSGRIITRTFGNTTADLKNWFHDELLKIKISHDYILLDMVKEKKNLKSSKGWRMSKVVGFVCLLFSTAFRKCPTEVSIAD